MLKSDCTCCQFFHSSNNFCFMYFKATLVNHTNLYLKQLLEKLFFCITYDDLVFS